MKLELGRKAMVDQVDVAVVGATGAVGTAILEIMAERDFPVRNLYALASERSAGSRLQFKETNVAVQNLATFDFTKAQIGLFSAGGSISAEYAPTAAEAGCVVIDNTSHFRRDPEIPLIVPEVNGHRLPEFRKRNIIANPNCSTIQMLVALKPIQDAVGIARINVASYQAVSGAGKHAMEVLAGQTARLLNAQPLDVEVFTKQIAFNVIPHIGDFQDNGYTLEEMKMVWETQKIFEDDRIAVNPTCARVPVFLGHSEAVHIETREKIGVDRVRELLAAAPGVQLLDVAADGGYPTPVEDAAGKDTVLVGRIREDISHPMGLDLWIVSDNVRKGAALNSVQIAEVLLKEL
jgi:aspartate-semialdehyde dehydrogenase